MYNYSLTFYSVALNLLDTFYPESSVTITSRDPPYMTAHVKAMLRRKNRLMWKCRVDEASALVRRISNEISLALTPNLYNKTKYVLYLRNLQLYTQLGMKVLKIHRVLAFDQKAYLAPYILFNTEKRQNARSDFEKDLYKLLSNAVYGKTIEQLRSRTHIKLISDPEMAKRYIRKPTCLLYTSDAADE